MFIVNLKLLKQLFVFDDYKETYRRVLSEIMKLENKAKDAEWQDAPPLTLNDLIAITENIYQQPQQVTDDNNL